MTIFLEIPETIRKSVQYLAEPISVMITLNKKVYSIKVSSDDNFMFSDCTVAYTKNKNNDLTWIQDWITYHVEIVGVDGVLIFDNDSDQYNTTEFLNFLTLIKLKQLVVVVLPLKYGS